MNRLGTKLILAFAGVTIVTVLLMGLPQLGAIARDNQELPATLRSALSARQVGRAIFFPPRAAHGGFGAIVTVSPWQLQQLQQERAQLQAQAAGTGSGSAAEPSLTSGVPIALNGAEGGPWVALGDLGAYLRGSIEERAATVVGSAALALAFAVGLALLLARVIAKPIQRVAVAANSVAAGDLSARVSVAPRHAGSKDETVRLAESFNVMADSLERLERQRRDMVADVAHELRTPLTVLRGRMEALEDGVVPLTLEEIGDMHSQVLVLTRLVEDLRVLSLADAGRLHLSPQDLDLAEMVRSAAAAHRALATAKGVALITAGAGPVHARLDPERMHQVLGNLLDNAVRHTPAGGSVTLTVAGEGGEAVLEVADTGPGIPQGLEERVFERFYRADESRSRGAGGGSGLGLAIVKAIVEAHGGSVSAGRAAGGGALLRVVVPGG